MSWGAAIAIVSAVFVMAVCLWTIGAVCGIAYTIEKTKTFKKPLLKEVVSEEKECEP